MYDMSSFFMKFQPKTLHDNFYRNLLRVYVRP